MANVTRLITGPPSSAAQRAGLDECLLQAGVGGGGGLTEQEHEGDLRMRAVSNHRDLSLHFVTPTSVGVNYFVGARAIRRLCVVMKGTHAFFFFFPAF